MPGIMRNLVTKSRRKTCLPAGRDLFAGELLKSEHALNLQIYLQMNYLKQIIITLICVSFSIALAAQNMSIGLRAGATYFTIHNEEINDDAQHTMGFNLAVPFEYRFTPLFSIQPEFHFIQKGVQFEEMEGDQEVDIAIKTNFIELPVLFKIGQEQNQFRYYLFAGPSVGYATNRFMTEKIGDGDRVKTDIDFIEGEVAESQRWEISAVAGIGGSVQAGIGALVVDIRYHLGLSDNTKFNVEKPEDWKRTTNRGCTFSLGYVIPFGK